MIQEKTGDGEKKGGRKEGKSEEEGWRMERGLGEIYRSAFPSLSLGGRKVFFLCFYAFQFYIF